MGTITHTFDPGQSVWVITPTGETCDSAVKSGTVIQVRGTALTTGTSVAYDVRLTGDNGTTEFDEADIFATLSEAMTEYESRLTP